MSYTAGWLACIAWQAISATDCYIVADMLQALITVQNPEYIPTRWAATLLTIATAIALSAFNTFAVRHLTVSEGVFTTCHVFAFVPVRLRASEAILALLRQRCADLRHALGDSIAQNHARRSLPPPPRLYQHLADQ